MGAPWLATTVLAVVGVGLAAVVQAHHHCIQDDVAASATIHEQAVVDKFLEEDDGVFNITVVYVDQGVCEEGSVGQTITLNLNCGSTTTHTCTEADVLTASRHQYLKSVVEETVQWWTETLQLRDGRPNYVDIGAFSQCCSVDLTGQPTGIQGTDYILYVTFKPTIGGNIGWASACVVWTGFPGEYVQHRPSAGQLNLGPGAVTGVLEEDLAIAKHEMAHALGFTGGMMANFKHPTDYTYTEITKQVTERGKNVTKLVTPNVISAVEEHFNCHAMTTPGAELEDGGGVGTATSHWESRVFMNDLMIGAKRQHMYVSNVTLALFDDSGWYIANRSRAEPIAFGRDEGCSFVEDTCDNRSDEYFCNFRATFSEYGYDACTVDKRSKGRCDKQQYSGALPTEYQYFADPNQGGLDELSDYCPFFDDRDGGDCTHVTAATEQVYGEGYGAQSYCFASTVRAPPVWTGSQMDEQEILDDNNLPQATRCHVTECNEVTGQLRVHMGNTSAPYAQCPRAGGLQDVHDLIVLSMKTPCTDSTTFVSTQGYSCATIASNDPGCADQLDPNTQINCPEACKTCVPYQGNLNCPVAADWGCFDVVAPTVTITGPSSPSSLDPIPFTLTLSEPPNNAFSFVAIDCANPTTTYYPELGEGDERVYVVECDQKHGVAVGVRVNAGAVTDAAGLSNADMVEATVQSVDVIAPTVAIAITLVSDSSTVASSSYLPAREALQFLITVSETHSLSLTATHCDQQSYVDNSAVDNTHTLVCAFEDGAAFVEVDATATDAAGLTGSAEGIVFVVTPTPTPTFDGVLRGVRGEIQLSNITAGELLANETKTQEAIAVTYMVPLSTVQILWIMDPNAKALSDEAVVSFLLQVEYTSQAVALQAVVDATPQATLEANLQSSLDKMVVLGTVSSEGVVEACVVGTTLANSPTDCSDVLPGDECAYTCDDHYFAEGSHVCGDSGELTGGACVLESPTPSGSPTTSPTASVSPSVTPTGSVTPSVTPTISITPSVTPTISITPSVTPTTSLTPSVTPTNSPTPSVTPTTSPTPSVTPTTSPTPSVTTSPTITPSVTPSPEDGPFYEQYKVELIIAAGVVASLALCAFVHTRQSKGDQHQSSRKQRRQQHQQEKQERQQEMQQRRKRNSTDRSEPVAILP